VTLDGDTIAMGFGDGAPISIDLPEGREGILQVTATATSDDSVQAQRSVWIDVKKAFVELTASKNPYKPGDTIGFQYHLFGDTLEEAYYKIMDGNGMLVSEGTATGGSFSLVIPSTNPPNSYTTTIYATGQDTIYTDAVWLNILNGYTLKYTVDKAAYDPGDTILVTYEIVKIGDPLDTVGGHVISVGFSNDEKSVWTKGTSGTIEYTIPSYIPEGDHLLFVSLDGAVLDDIQTVKVSSSGGALAYGTIAGMNSGAFLSLLVALLALILVLVVMRKLKKGRGGATPPPEMPGPPVTQEGFTPEPTPEGFTQPQGPPTEAPEQAQDGNVPQQYPPQQGPEQLPEDSPPEQATETQEGWNEPKAPE
ncbi:MAG: hypothetical protein KAT70_01310, partial [Thermoplasmata archaeon]|nr:hypothetical protein [Thermoplasmata archaeon]